MSAAAERREVAIDDAVERRRGARSWLRRLLLAGIGLLYVVSVPWYRDSGEPLSLVFGLPDWVAVALLCYVGVAVLNAIAWLLTDVSDDSPSFEGAAAPFEGAAAPFEGAAAPDEMAAAPRPEEASP